MPFTMIFDTSMGIDGWMWFCTRMFMLLVHFCWLDHIIGSLLICTLHICDFGTSKNHIGLCLVCLNLMQTTVEY
jgi:hypothetical protein